jgi:hypothetical protein
VNPDTRVWARLPSEIHEYFFRHVLAGEHRVKQDLTTLFWQALYTECQRRNIPASWSMENSQLVHEVASQLTFSTGNDDSQPDRSRCSADPIVEHPA